MILSSAITHDALFQDRQMEGDPQAATPRGFSEEWLNLSHALHRVAGDSLSALGLQLELHRQRMADDAIVDSLDTFPRAAELLDILRAAQELSDEEIYLSSVIWSLARGLPEATVYLEGFERTPLHSVQQAETLLHCAREALLSAARFGADKVRLRLHRDGDRVSLEAEDNGRGSRERPAHELIGLRTRINTLNGKLRVEDRQRGWKLVATLPRSSTPAAP